MCPWTNRPPWRRPREPWEEPSPIKSAFCPGRKESDLRAIRARTAAETPLTHETNSPHLPRAPRTVTSCRNENVTERRDSAESSTTTTAPLDQAEPGRNKMPFSVNGILCALVPLLLWRAEQRVEACSCAPVHPQQAFCNADVVIRAKVVGEREVDSGNDIYGNPIKRIQYEVKQIKMFKGPSQDIESVFTAPVSAVCGVTLDASGKKDYLISGKAESAGTMHVTLCDYIQPWDLLSATQKKSLSQRYQMGCDCKIVRCPSLPCEISAPEECLWTDLMIEKQVYGRQANHYACVKRADASCSWYRGVAPPKKDFLDAEDP